MAITNNGIKVLLSEVPSGYSRPSISEFTDFEYKKEVVLNVLKSTVENATAATTLTNIINDATIGLNKQVSDILAADFLATATVTAFAVLKKITTNLEPKSSGVFYTNAPLNYLCSVEIYIKTA